MEEEKNDAVAPEGDAAEGETPAATPAEGENNEG